MKNVKRILILLLVAVMVLSLVACGEAKNGKTAGAVIGEGTVQLPEGFTAGFGRADITPIKLPIPVDASSGDYVADKLYATCIAVSDGTDVALLYSMDMKNIPEDFYPEAARRIEAAYGIPKANVVLNAMHTHNAPAAQSTNKDGIIEWRELAYQGILAAAKSAMEDLAPATAYTGRADTTGMAFVRRYLDVLTGRCLNMHEAVSKGLATRETEADPELRTIRFDRGEEKKDILLVNWQAHAAHGQTSIKGAISADYVGVTRNGVESTMGVHFAFFMGASGNINLQDKLAGTTLDWKVVGTQLVTKIQEALAAETPVEVGTDVKVSQTIVDGKVIQETPERILAAQQYSAAKGAAEKDQIIKDYNLDTEHDVTAIQYRVKYGETHDIPLTAVSFGDIAFATAGYEMFDTNGKDIREGSPFQTTFICSLTNSNLGYFPDSDIWDNKGYEVVAARFEKGHAEICANTLIDMLKAQAG